MDTTSSRPGTGIDDEDDDTLTGETIQDSTGDDVESAIGSRDEDDDDLDTVR
jgi:hypothetical protein